MPEVEEDRKQLRAALDQLYRIVDCPEPTGAPVLAQLRWELARRLFTYLTLDAMLDARRQARSVDLLDQVRSHFHVWSSNRIHAEWPDYRRETRSLVRSLQHHLA